MPWRLTFGRNEAAHSPPAPRQWLFTGIFDPLFCCLQYMTFAMKSKGSMIIPFPCVDAPLKTELFPKRNGLKPKRHILYRMGLVKEVGWIYNMVMET